jgi:hypothetical protein
MDNTTVQDCFQRPDYKNKWSSNTTQPNPACYKYVAPESYNGVIIVIGIIVLIYFTNN